MGESEKGASSNSKDKLDEDMSKDFLSSWKSLSVTGGDDMDFNFEPVSKGKKKAFDFDKLDMDFSLDGEFGKISSFKIDMPDLDFSSSPKKSVKSKDKSEDESAKGSLPNKHDKFTFSFDFNGLDDFSLDTTSMKGGKNPSEDRSNKELHSMNKIVCEDLPRQVDGKGATEDAINKTSPVSKDATNSKSANVVDDGGKLDVSPRDSPSKSTMLVDLIKPKETEVFSKENLAFNTKEADHQCHLVEKRTSNELNVRRRADETDSIPESSLPQSYALMAPVLSADTNMSLEAPITMAARGSDEEIHVREMMTSKQPHEQPKAKDLSETALLVNTSTQDTVSDKMEVCPLEEKPNNGSSVGCTLTGEAPGATDLTKDIEKMKPNKSPQCLIDRTNISSEKNELGDVGSSSKNEPSLDIIDTSASSVPKKLSSDARCVAEKQRSASNTFSEPSGSGPTIAKPILMAYKVPGANQLKFSTVREANDSGRMKLAILDKNRRGSTYLGVLDRSDPNSSSSKENGKKLAGNLSLCSKDLVKQDSASDKCVKNVEADSDSREGSNNMRGNIRSEMGVDLLLHDEQVMLGGKKSIKDVKSSCFRVSPSASLKQETKFSNQDLGKFKDKLSSTVSIQKSNFTEVNKLPSLRIGKGMASLSSSKISRSIAANKHSASPSGKENAQYLGNTEKSIRLQAINKMVLPVVADKQTPSTRSLKRKPSEAADVGTAELHSSKRLSPSQSRMFKELSAGEIEEEVNPQGTLLEGSRENAAAQCPAPKFDLCQETSMEDLGFTLLVESDANIEKAEACAKELEDICNMLKKKHEEAKELLVRALVNNNNLLMLNHPIYDEKIRAVQRFADRLTSKELEAGA